MVPDIMFFMNSRMKCDIMFWKAIISPKYRAFPVEFQEENHAYSTHLAIHNSKHFYYCSLSQLFGLAFASFSGFKFLWNQLISSKNQYYLLKLFFKLLNRKYLIGSFYYFSHSVIQNPAKNNTTSRCYVTFHIPSSLKSLCARSVNLVR